MAQRLSDLVDVKITTDVIRIQNEEIPVSFGFEAMEFVAEYYSVEDGNNTDYAEFEIELNQMLNTKDVRLNAQTLKIMRALIYGMIRAGGLECTPKEVFGAIPLSQVADIFQVCLDLKERQDFQGEDLKKSVKPQDKKPKQRAVATKQKKTQMKN